MAIRPVHPQVRDHLIGVRETTLYRASGSQLYSLEPFYFAILLITFSLLGRVTRQHNALTTSPNSTDHLLHVSLPYGTAVRARRAQLSWEVRRLRRQLPVRMPQLEAVFAAARPGVGKIKGDSIRRKGDGWRGGKGMERGMERVQGNGKGNGEGAREVEGRRKGRGLRRRAWQVDGGLDGGGYKKDEDRLAPSPESPQQSSRREWGRHRGDGGWGTDNEGLVEWG